MKYKNYLKSEEWKAKRRIAKRLHLDECYLCGRKKVDIHHLTYKRFQSEDPENDLIPLCRKHHLKVHRHAIETSQNIWNATHQLITPKKRFKSKSWSTMTPIERKRLLEKDNW